MTVGYVLTQIDYYHLVFIVRPSILKLHSSLIDRETRRCSSQVIQYSPLETKRHMKLIGSARTATQTKNDIIIQTAIFFFGNVTVWC